MFRVAVTTTPGRAKRVAATTRAHGLEPVLLPCIEVEPAADAALESARSAARRSDWLVVTSPRAVAAVWPAGDMPDVPVAAVGPATAEAVGAAGGTVSLVGHAGAASLVDELADAVAGTSVLLPHGSRADRTVHEALSDAGADLTAVVVYDTRPIPPGPDPVDAAVFASPSAVAGWCLARGLDDVITAAIGPTTASALEKRGHPPEVIPPRPDFDTLIDLLATRLRERSPV